MLPVENKQICQIDNEVEILVNILSVKSEEAIITKCLGVGQGNPSSKTEAQLRKIFSIYSTFQMNGY